MPHPFRAAALLAGAVLLLPATPAPAQTQPPNADATWRARLMCDPLPPITQNPLNQAITVTVQGGIARYERIVSDQHGRPTGYAERGQGTVGRDGALTLEGLATGRNFRYTARYSGHLRANGTGSLIGEQHWSADNAVGQLTRPCRIGLRREGASQ
jgi:hypothetical protein